MHAAPEASAWIPAVDVYEYPEAFVICLEVAGVQAADLEVLIHDRLVVVNGRRELPVAREMTPHRMELVRGPFARRIHLPVALDADRSQTQLTNGLLLLHVPKRVPARRIRVQA